VRNSVLLLAAVLAAAFGGFGRPGGSAQKSSWPPGPARVSFRLWPHGVPDATPPAGPEEDTNTAADPLIAGKSIIRLANVSIPTITLYKPKGKNTGAAVVVFPGGGYRILAMDLEGTEVCDWLNSIGVTCVLLKYRVPNSGPYPKSPQALEDAQRAVGMVRARAAQWQIDPHRIGVLGFSAGGHLAAAISTHYDHRLYPTVDSDDQQSCRPDFAVVIYPGYLALSEKNFEFNADIPVTTNTAPTFLLQAEDDPVHVENVVEYFMQLKHANVPAELHVYAHGGHGYGLRPTELPITHWPRLVDAWLHTIHVLSTPGS
jgi:acetyl esterase/lipase